MDCHLIYWGCTIQNRIIRPVEIHISHNIAIRHCIIITHIDHYLDTTVPDCFQLGFLCLQHLLSADRVLLVIIRIQLYANLLERYVSLILTGCLHQIISHLGCQRCFQQIMRLLLLSLGICNGRVWINLCLILADKSCRIRKYPESVK